MGRSVFLRLCFYCAVALGATGFTAHHPHDVPRHGRPAHHRVQIGIASWYGGRHQGKPTASGVPFDRHKLTAAHNTLPLITKARVTNLQNHRSVEVTINDRGPGVRGRTIDLSERAARQLGMKKDGLALVKIVPIPRRVALD